MTDPRDDDPFRGLPTTGGGFRRELIGLLLFLAGGFTLLFLLLAVDGRLALGYLAALAMVAGLLLGRGRDEEV